MTTYTGPPLSLPKPAAAEEGWDDLVNDGFDRINEFARDHVHEGGGTSTKVPHSNLSSVGANDHHEKEHDHKSSDGSNPLTNDEHDGYSEYTESAQPGIPAAGKRRVFADSSDGGKLKVGAPGGRRSAMGEMGKARLRDYKTSTNSWSDAIAAFTLDRPAGTTMLVDEPGIYLLDSMYTMTAGYGLEMLGHTDDDSPDGTRTAVLKANAAMAAVVKVQDPTCRVRSAHIDGAGLATAALLWLTGAGGAQGHLDDVGVVRGTTYAFQGGDGVNACAELNIGHMCARMPQSSGPGTRAFRILGRDHIVGMIRATGGEYVFHGSDGGSEYGVLHLTGRGQGAPPTQGCFLREGSDHCDYGQVYIDTCGVGPLLTYKTAAGKCDYHTIEQVRFRNIVQGQPVILLDGTPGGDFQGLQVRTFHGSDNSGNFGPGSQFVRRIGTAAVKNFKLGDGMMQGIGTGSEWVALTNYVLNDYVVPTTLNGFVYRCTADAGSSGAGEPAAWPTVIGNTVVDGGITWTCDHVDSLYGSGAGVAVSRPQEIGDIVLIPQVGSDRRTRLKLNTSIVGDGTAGPYSISPIGLWVPNLAAGMTDYEPRVVIATPSGANAQTIKRVDYVPSTDVVWNDKVEITFGAAIGNGLSVKIFLLLEL
jgi:hypothetical protein